MKTKKKTTYKDLVNFNVYQRADGAEIWWTKKRVRDPKFMPVLDFTPRNYEINAFQKGRDYPDSVIEEEIFDDPEYKLVEKLFNKGILFVAVVKRKGNKICQREYCNASGSGKFVPSCVYGKIWTFNLNDKRNYF